MRRNVQGNNTLRGKWARGRNKLGAKASLWQNEVGVKSRQYSYFTFLSHLKNNIRRRYTSSKSSSVPFSAGPFVRFLRAQKLHIDFHYKARHLNVGGAGQKYKYFKRTLLLIIPADTVLNTPATFHNTTFKFKARRWKWYYYYMRMNHAPGRIRFYYMRMKHTAGYLRFIYSIPAPHCLKRRVITSAITFTSHQLEMGIYRALET